MLTPNDVRGLPLKARVTKAITWGLQMAAVFAFFAVLARIIGGNAVFSEGLSFGQALAAEFGSGLLGGAMLGISLPWITSIIRAGFIGALIGAASGVVSLAANKGISGWVPSDLYIALAFAFIGLVTSTGLWRRARLTQ